MNESCTNVMPITWERLLAERRAPYRVADAGSNRTPADICTIRARDDIDAIQMWLDEQSQSPATLRAYTKEIERFYNWLVLIRRKSVGSVVEDDIAGYMAFMSHPDPLWCGPRNGPRHTNRWRPFEQALSPESRLRAHIILRSCFSYLVEVRYLFLNPFRAVRARRKTKADSFLTESQKHCFSISTLEKLIGALQHQITMSRSQARVGLEAAERQLFVVQFLCNTGLRGQELAKAKMSDFTCNEHKPTGGVYWTLKVEGKAHINRIAITRGAIEAVRRYRTSLGASVMGGDPSPLLLPLTGQDSANRCLTAQTVYGIVTAALEAASSHYQMTDPEFARLFAQSKPDWCRRTFVCVAEQLGATPRQIQKQLGHKSLQSIDRALAYPDLAQFLEALSAAKF
ncbi:site-specific integrase [Paraburkholderia dipogonis]|uniref:Site-specific integrase n=1 Tax=Paraburkholderia dipogonis TaxID=1211383 RepID=A0ABW9B237_9BURK